MEKPLPPIPAKRYFTIGEVGELCGVKPHVLRYWEQEFTQLRPMKRRGNRRYYQHHEVLMIRRIRELLYDQGFTISGARNKLQEMAHSEKELRHTNGEAPADEADPDHHKSSDARMAASTVAPDTAGLKPDTVGGAGGWVGGVRRELMEIRELLTPHF